MTMKRRRGTCWLLERPHKNLQRSRQKSRQSREVNIARIANAVPVTLYSRVTMNVEIVVLNCQKCNQMSDEANYSAVPCLLRGTAKNKPSFCLCQQIQ